MGDIFAIYEALWRCAEAEGVWVHYYGLDPMGRGGYFDPRIDEENCPLIAILRPYYKEPSETPTRESNAPPDKPQPDIFEELMTLAHEYGHFGSFSGRTPRDEYLIYDLVAHERSEIEDDSWEHVPDNLDNQAANDHVRRSLGARLGEDKCARIIREETTAWEVGREALVAVGMTYDERRRRGLHFHRYKLGLDELWPDDH